MSTVYIIAGPNGAGKTTFACRFLPDFVHCREYLNVDLIAQGLSPLQPEAASMRAGRLFLDRINELASQRLDFAFETTLAGRTHAHLLRQLRESGYEMILFFLWLPSPRLAVARVARRVSEGGHYVPSADVFRRYRSGLENLTNLYLPLVDTWFMYNASVLPPSIIARNHMGLTEIADETTYRRIIENRHE